MIEIVSGNLFESGCQSLVNCINLRGVMGKGIALEFKNQFPAMFKDYVKACNKKQIKLGKMWNWYDALFNRYIINFPTKDDWKYSSKLEWIDSGLDDLKNVIINLEIESIAIPALGCQNGGLDWNVVKPLIISKLESLEKVKILLYQPLK